VGIVELPVVVVVVVVVAVEVLEEPPQPIAIRSEPVAMRATLRSR